MGNSSIHSNKQPAEVSMTKKMLILNAIQLGMEPSRAFILAQLTSEQIEVIESDESFCFEIALTEVQQEQALLAKFHEALDIAARKGNTKPIEFFLAKMKGTKWAEKDKSEVDALCKLLISDRERNIV